MIFREEPCPFDLPMSAERLWWTLECIGWTGGELRRRLGINERTVTRWLGNVKPPPNRVAVWLEMVRRMVVSVSQPLEWTENAEHIPPPLHQALEHAHDDEELVESAEG